VDCGQKFLAIAEVIFAKLAADVAVRLEQLDNRRVLGLNSECRRRKADLIQAGADGRLSGDECCATRVQLCCPYQSVNHPPSVAMHLRTPAHSSAFQRICYAELF
jgi:hypothetical protein